MAKKIEVYVCDFCKRHYYDEVDALKCERGHMSNARIVNVSYDKEINASFNNTFSKDTVLVPAEMKIDFDYYNHVTFNRYAVSMLYKFNSICNVSRKVK